MASRLRWSTAFAAGKKLPSAFVIAGNVGTPEGVMDLERWGADATKVGVGPG